MEADFTSSGVNVMKWGVRTGGIPVVYCHAPAHIMASLFRFSVCQILELTAASVYFQFSDEIDPSFVLERVCVRCVSSKKGPFLSRPW